jgi:DNA-binding response OmpR family regulator
MAKKVLIVDDDQNAVKFLSAVLEDNGYEFGAAYDGNEGMKKIEESKPDLIILDVMMPKKTGFVLFKQLRRKDEFKDIPVLMLTGVAGVLEELEQGKDDSDEKPYDSLREALKKTIKEMREEGLVRPEMFVDKPVDPDAFIARVRDLIGS